jgi:phosphatidylglycerol:prolipoprotein diacylglycerol transferase
MREGFQIGPLIIRYYALIIMAGVFVAAWLSTVEAKRRGKDTEKIWDMLPWIVIGGIIGARIWHILTPDAESVKAGITTGWYLAHPLDAIAIWKGGLGIPGGVIGGALALLIYTRRSKEDFLEWADIIVPGLAVAQAIGRWGNFVNQELYGLPSELPWAIYIDPEHRISEFASVERYHPLFLYESLLNLLAAGILLIVGRKYKEKLLKGDLFIIYLILYPVIRFSLEFLRLVISPVGGININQTVMAVVAVTSAVILIVRHKRNSQLISDEIMLSTEPEPGDDLAKESDNDNLVDGPQEEEKIE